MVKVPEYQPNVQLRPALRSDFSVRASPEAFGAGVGRGMVQAAQGLSNLSDAAAAVQDLEDTARAKEADNSYSNWMRERMYGEGGFMTLEGRNAVDGRRAFEAEAEQKRKEFGQGLTPGAAKSYQTASQARLQSVYQQSIVHTAEARKSWFKEASAARMETFANDALVNFNKPALVTKNIAAGVLELRQKGELEGWDADTLKAREAEYVSGVHKNITLRMAQDDALAADAYMKAHANGLSGADQYALRRSLDTEIKNEQSKREADAILMGGRQVSPEGAAAPSAGRGGPTRSKAFLASRSAHQDRPGDTLNLDDAFADNLAAMIQDAPPEIREGLGLGSAYRSNARQEQLFARSDRTGRKVAFPAGYQKPDGSIARGSNHTHGRAVDLTWKGEFLNHAPKHVRDWVHQNAASYGLRFPMSYEPWHIEPMKGNSGTVEARNNSIAPRSLMPSYDEIEAKLAAISDPDVRDLTRKRLYSAMEAQSKAQEQQEKAAKAELWKYTDQGLTPDQVPMEVRQAAGMAAVSAAWGYLETAAKGREVESDETLLYDMRRYSATNPTEFANIDLNDYRDRLSKEAIKELTDTQASALTDMRKAKEDGLNLTAAFSQAGSQLEAVGLTTTGRDGEDREAVAKRIAEFQNSLAVQMQEFKRQNQDRAPNQMEVQSMINRMLMPIVMKRDVERSIFNPLKTPWSSTYTEKTDGFLFEARKRPDGSTVDVVTEYADIPIELRSGIARDLELELGRKPSDQEVVQRYREFSGVSSRAPVDETVGRTRMIIQP